MRGRQIVIEPLASGGQAAALLVDGRLTDLLIDSGPADATPRPESIWRGVAARPMKGMGGVMVELGDGGGRTGGGRTGWLRGPKLPAPGRPILVQVTGWAEPGKAPPVTTRVLLKGRTAILTPGAPGANVARGLADPDRRATLAAVAAEAMAGAGDVGVIVRSAAEEADDATVRAEIAALREEWAALAAGTAAGLVRAAPGAAAEALREWRQPGDAVREAPGALLDAGVWDTVDELRQPLVALGEGSMAIEPTRALVAVDVNTGRDGSPAAALKANLAAVRELPRQLRLRGLGGQVVVDFAPLARTERARIEQALGAALKADGIETTVLGWTPGGNLELQRKRARRPL